MIEVRKVSLCVCVSEGTEGVFCVYVFILGFLLLLLLLFSPEHTKAFIIYVYCLEPRWIPSPFLEPSSQ